MFTHTHTHHRPPSVQPKHVPAPEVFNLPDRLVDNIHVLRTDPRPPVQPQPQQQQQLQVPQPQQPVGSFSIVSDPSADLALAHMLMQEDANPEDLQAAALGHLTLDSLMPNRSQQAKWASAPSRATHPRPVPSRFNSRPSPGSLSLPSLSHSSSSSPASTRLSVPAPEIMPAEPERLPSPPPQPPTPEPKAEPEPEFEPEPTPPAPAPAPTKRTGRTAKRTPAPRRQECQTCGKKFQRPCQLTTHIRSHTGEQRTDLGAGTARAVSRGAVIVPGLSGRELGAAQMDRRELAIPVARLFLSTPHACPVCSRRFSVLSNCQRHVKLCQKRSPKVVQPGDEGVATEPSPAFIQYPADPPVENVRRPNEVPIRPKLESKASGSSNADIPKRKRSTSSGSEKKEEPEPPVVPSSPAYPSGSYGNSYGYTQPQPYAQNENYQSYPGYNQNYGYAQAAGYDQAPYAYPGYEQSSASSGYAYASSPSHVASPSHVQQPVPLPASVSHRTLSVGPTPLMYNATLSRTSSMDAQEGYFGGVYAPRAVPAQRRPSVPSTPQDTHAHMREVHEPAMIAQDPAPARPNDAGAGPPSSYPFPQQFEPKQEEAEWTSPEGPEFQGYSGQPWTNESVQYRNGASGMVGPHGSGDYSYPQPLYQQGYTNPPGPQDAYGNTGYGHPPYDMSSGVAANQDSNYGWTAGSETRWNHAGYSS